jgi:hypothetical protein
VIVLKNEKPGLTAGKKVLLRHEENNKLRKWSWRMEEANNGRSNADNTSSSTRAGMLC